MQSSRVHLNTIILYLSSTTIVPLHRQLSFEIHVKYNVDTLLNRLKKNVWREEWKKKLQQQFTLSVTPKKRNWNNKGKIKKKAIFFILQQNK